MKQRNREINIFNMSALDLFASALGAFILITIILLPFFPNLDPNPKQNRREKTVARLDAALGDVKELQTQLAESNAREQELQEKIESRTDEPKKEKTPPKLAFPPLDLVIALDTTGSMHEQIKGLKNEIEQIASLLLKFAPSVGIGVIDFKDRCEGRRALRTFPLIEINDVSMLDLFRFTRSIRRGNYTRCNEDPEEAINLAFERATAMPWRSQAKARIIVIISDNPAYPETQASVLQQASQFAASRQGNRVSTVYVPTWRYALGIADSSEFLERLAQAGKGQFVGGGGSFTATILLALADT